MNPKNLRLDWHDGRLRTAVFGTLFGLTIVALFLVLFDYTMNNGAYQAPGALTLGLLFGATMALVLFSEYQDQREPAIRPLANEQAESESDVRAGESVPVRPPKAARTVQFEYGEPELKVTIPPVTAEALSVQDTTNILCRACGDHFEIDLPPVRPMLLECPECGTHLTALGERHTSEAIDVRCRHCHAPHALPKDDEVASFQCIQCGRPNRLRAVGAVPGTEVSETFGRSSSKGQVPPSRY